MLVNLRRNSTSAEKKNDDLQYFRLFQISAISSRPPNPPHHKKDRHENEKEGKKKRSKIPRPAARDQSDFTTFLRQILITCTGSQRLTTTKKDLAQVQKFLLSPSNKDFVQRKKNSTFCLRTIRYTFRPLWYLVLRLATHPATHTWDRSQEIISNVACNRTPLLSRQV